MTDTKWGDWGDKAGRAPDLSDRAEREAVALVLLDSKIMCDQHKKGWVCTRPPSHDGDHVAANSRRIMARWRNSRRSTER